VNNFIITGGGGGGGAGAGKPMTFNSPVTPSTGNLVSYFTDTEAFISIGISSPTLLQIQGSPSINWVRDIATDFSGATGIAGVVLLQNKIYVLGKNSSGIASAVYMYNALDDTIAGTLMTFSGETLGATGSSTMTCDGSNFYFSYDAGNNSADNLIAKFTLAATTFTYVSTTTMTGGAGLFTPNFLVSADGEYYGFNTSGNKIVQFNSVGAVLVTSGQLAFVSNTPLVNYANTFYAGRKNSVTNGYEYIKIYIADTDNGASTIINGNANRNLIPGNTVGIAPFGGGFDYANKYSVSASFPDTVDESGANPFQTQWLDTNNIFVLYHVNGGTVLKGVVGTINPSTRTISWGTPHIYTSTLYVPTIDGTNSQMFSLCKFVADKVGVFFVQTAAENQIVLDITTTAAQVITPSGNQNFGSALANHLTALASVGLSGTAGAIFKNETSSHLPAYIAFSFTGTTLGTVGTAVAGIDQTANSYKLIVSSVAGNKITLIPQVTSGEPIYIQTATVSGTTIASVGTAIDLATPSGGSQTFSDIAYLADDKFAVSYSGAGPSGIADIGTQSGDTISMSGSAYDVPSAGGQPGSSLILISSSLVVVTGQNGWYAIDVSGATPALAYLVQGSGSAITIVPQSFIQLAGYFVVLNLVIPVVGGGGNIDQVYMQGMSFTYKGICQTTSSRGTSAGVMIIGQDNNQTGVFIGQDYEPDGNGSIQQGAGNMQGIEATSVVLS